jgi:hypothetical protein
MKEKNIFRLIIGMIEANDLTGAIQTVKSLQSGIDWNYADNDEEEDASGAGEYWPKQQWDDGELYSVLNDIHSARMFPGADREHFKQVAILRLRVISGDASARKQLERAIATGAAAAEGQLRRYEGGNN